MDQSWIALRLPYPPSANTYYRQYRGRILLSSKGRTYKKTVGLLCLPHMRQTKGLREAKNIIVHYEVYPPDKKKRDLDNLAKPLNDALESIFIDDARICRLTLNRAVVKPPGHVVAVILW